MTSCAKKILPVTLNLYEMIAGAILRYRIILYHLRFKKSKPIRVWCHPPAGCTGRTGGVQTGGRTGRPGRQAIVR